MIKQTLQMKPLTELNIQINDITCDMFNQYGIQVDPRLSIRESALGGTGIFFEAEEDIDEPIAIARIPSSITFSLKSLAQILAKLEQVNKVEAAIVKTVLKFCGGTNETEIITDYIFSFMIILTNNEHHHDCPVAAVSFYLEILSKTNVAMLDLQPFAEEDASLDYLFKVEQNKFERIKNKYENILGSLSDLKYTVPSFEEYYHIHKVVKSRVLEIPQQADDKSDDFYVNTTLVPLLDYANHLEDNNAFFDIDRTNNDVLLKYEGSKGLNEVCIKYSSVNSVQEFVSTYGFIPQGKEVVFELRLDKYDINKYVNEVQGTADVQYDLIMKWLQILPTTQLVKKGERVGINYEFNPVPMWNLFTAKFKYLGIPSTVDINVINDPDLLSDNVSKESISKLIKFQQQHCDVIQGVETIAIAPTECDDTKRDEAIFLFNKFVRKICRHQPFVSADGLTKEYLAFKMQLFEQIQNQHDFDISYNKLWDEAATYPFSVIYDYM